MGVILVVGYFFGLVAEKLKLPRISAYLISGILFSENLLGNLLGLHFNSWSELMVDICLGLIAFIIGGKIKITDFLSNGKSVIWGTLLSSLFPMVLVFLGFYLFFV